MCELFRYVSHSSKQSLPAFSDRCRSPLSCCQIRYPSASDRCVRFRSLSLSICVESSSIRDLLQSPRSTPCTSDPQTTASRPAHYAARVHHRNPIPHRRIRLRHAVTHLRHARPKSNSVSPDNPNTPSCASTLRTHPHTPPRLPAAVRTASRIPRMPAPLSRAAGRSRPAPRPLHSVPPAPPPNTSDRR